MVDFEKKLKEKKESKESKEETVELSDNSIETKQDELNESMSVWNKKTKSDFSKEGNKLSPLVERMKVSPERFAKGQYVVCTCKFGLTLNLLNMEYARYDVGLESFCDPEDHDDLFDMMELYLKKRSFKTAANVKAYLDKKREKGIGE